MTWRHCHLVEPDVNTSAVSTALSTVSLFGSPVGDLKAENAGSGAKESQSTPCLHKLINGMCIIFCLFEFVWIASQIMFELTHSNSILCVWFGFCANHI